MGLEGGSEYAVHIHIRSLSAISVEHARCPVIGAKPPTSLVGIILSDLWLFTRVGELATDQKQIHLEAMNRPFVTGAEPGVGAGQFAQT
jgi:hypothetical protein